MKLDRRALLGRGLQGVGLVALVRSAPLVLLESLASWGCSGESLRCYDPELLSTPERALRRTRGYADRSPRPGEQECRGCQFFHQASASSPECGACSILAGPVDARGRCDAWTERTAA